MRCPASCARSPPGLVAQSITASRISEVFKMVRLLVVVWLVPSGRSMHGGSFPGHRQLTAPPYNRSMVPRGGADRLRIGAFQLDLHTGELHTGTGKLMLASQPFRILEMLARRPAEVVTRREIREALWPDGTMVEFEHSINVAIRRLRSTFGWPAGVGIETVRGRGY